MKNFIVNVVLLVIFAFNCHSQDTVQYGDPYYYFNERHYYVEPRDGVFPISSWYCVPTAFAGDFVLMYHTQEPMMVFGVAIATDTNVNYIDKLPFELNLAQLRNDSLVFIDSTRWKSDDGRSWFNFSVPYQGQTYERAVPIFELYFDTPLVVYDTFFVGYKYDYNGYGMGIYYSMDSSSSLFILDAHQHVSNCLNYIDYNHQYVWEGLFPIIQPNRHCSVPAAPQLLVYNATNTVRFTLPYSPNDSLILSVARYGQPADSGMIYPVTDRVFDLVIPDSGRYTAQLGRICPRYGGIILQSNWGDPTTFLIMNNLAIEQSSIPTLEVYPNPTDGTVRIDAEGIREVWCIAADGRRTMLKVKGSQVSLKDYPAGLYVLEIQTDEGLYTAKVVRR